jgi:hypothetical protein
MGISQEKCKSGTGSATRAFGHILQKILYRGRLLVALVACVGLLAAGVAAQEERPQIMPGERKPAQKKDAGPRALGVLRLGANGKTSLVPIAILINGKFWDAAVYKAAPVPMALEPGTVYEVERTGNSLGLFTVGGALHSIAVNAQSPWLGTGTWLPTGTEAAQTTLKAETAPVGIDTSDAPPRLTRNPAKETPPPANPAPPPSAPAPGPSSGDEPPRLTKPTAPAPPSAPPSSAPQTSPSSTGSAAPAESKPNEAKTVDHPSEPPKEPDTNSGATDANRPILRRGKPTGPLPDDEFPGYSKPGASPPPSAGKSAATTIAPESVQLIPAISDADGPEPRSFTFEWLKDEEGERRQQMTALAKQELHGYLEAQAKARIPATGTAAQRHAPATKSPEPVFNNVQMVAYDLWTTNQPVILFGAQAHVPPAAGSPGSSEGLQYTIMIVAYPDIYNNLHKLYVGITDKYHLDVTPRLELIDAVDADGDGRGELLFRETSDAGSGWVIYRATADKLWKMYDSLNPE